MISHAVAGLGITASALGLVLLLRRYADRRPWSGIGLTLDRAAIPRLLFGIVLAAIVTTVAAAATVQLSIPARPSPTAQAASSANLRSLTVKSTGCCVAPPQCYYSIRSGGCAYGRCQ